MAQEWHKLTELTGGRAVRVERVRLEKAGIAIEGDFELPPLARLSAEDQVFVAAFVRSHGSIKQMEQFFGVSYPTIKNRLNRLGGQLDFVEIESTPVEADILGLIERGEMTVEEAVERLKHKEH